MSSKLKSKLLFRSKHRGFKEADIILGSFAEANLSAMDEGELQEYEKILEQPDNDIYDWFTGKLSPPAEFEGRVMRKLLAHRVV